MLAESDDGNVELDGRKNFRVHTFIAILDRLHTDLKERYFSKIHCTYRTTLKESELRKENIKLHEKNKRFARKIVHEKKSK